MDKEINDLIGKCGFYCGSCPTYVEGECRGCRLAHNKGDCYTFDCVTSKGIDYCGLCEDFPCNEIIIRKKATVLDLGWLEWKKSQRDNKNMNLVNIRIFKEKDREDIIKLVANFRVELLVLKGIKKEVNLGMAKEEVQHYIDNRYPIFVAESNKNIIVGYLVCKVEEDIVWAESLYVLPEYRRKGIASLLFNEAEKLVRKFGGDTVYNWVHPKYIHEHVDKEILPKEPFSFDRYYNFLLKVIMIY